ncbi:MAG: hypothetical protein LBR91_00595 [Puniceicoccales bacterium]|jgi:hypothetical protein|nr:hypothetical protein [Puniceicoccales bacterium]
MNVSNTKTEPKIIVSFDARAHTSKISDGGVVSALGFTGIGQAKVTDTRSFQVSRMAVDGSTSSLYEMDAIKIDNREISCVLKKYNYRSVIFENESRIYKKISQTRKIILAGGAPHYVKQMMEVLPTCYGVLEFSDETAGLLLKRANGPTLEKHNESCASSGTDMKSKQSRFLMLAQAALAGAAFHEIGIEHSDFHSGNLILHSDNSHQSEVVVPVDVGEAHSFNSEDGVEKKCCDNGKLCDIHRFAITIFGPTLLPNISTFYREGNEVSEDLSSSAESDRKNATDGSTVAVNPVDDVESCIVNFCNTIEEKDENKNPIHMANNALPEQSRFSADDLVFIKKVLLTLLKLDHKKLHKMLWASKALELASTGMSVDDIFKILGEEFPEISC